MPGRASDTLPGVGIFFAGIDGDRDFGVTQAASDTVVSTAGGGFAGDHGVVCGGVDGRGNLQVLDTVA